MSEDPEELIPYDLTAEPKTHVLLQPGWGERFMELTPRAQRCRCSVLPIEPVEYCNVCENFPCLGNHPPDAIAEALERYERAAAFIRRGVITRAELEQEVLGYDMVPTPWPDPPPYSPMRNWFRVGPSIAEQRAAEERNRRDWTESIRRRLGLVAEVHRCRVWYVGDGWWQWWCLRPGCPCGGFARRGPGAFAQAFAEALEHARRFVPQPPEPRVLDHLDWTVLASFHDYISGVAVPPLVGAGLDLTGWGPTS